MKPGPTIAAFLILLIAGMPSTLLAKPKSIVRDEYDPLIFTVVGGEEVAARQLVFDECTKTSRYLYRAVLVSEERSWIAPTERKFRCDLLDNDSESERPTSLQQKLLQTRRFKKDLETVCKAVSQWADDNGWQGALYCGPGVKNLSSQSGNFRVELGDSNLPHWLEVDIELKNSSENVTDVRVRTFFVITVRKEFFSKRTYQSIFNDFAQQLFIEAIEITPSEIQ